MSRSRQPNQLPQLVQLDWERVEGRFVYRRARIDRARVRREHFER